jgi:hypothetical protein
MNAMYECPVRKHIQRDDDDDEKMNDEALVCKSTYDADMHAHTSTTHAHTHTHTHTQERREGKKIFISSANICTVALAHRACGTFDAEQCTAFGTSISTCN